ncbi:MAG: metalloregulator ArsR/SmtB family transcription factor [Gemmatimonadota bacterium]|mgnify:FL=1|jgi:ArsR family transcriptional regulator
MATLGFDPGLRVARMCKALGHPARVAIVRYLKSRRGAPTCGEIVSQLPLSQSTVSQHLRVLQYAGFVTAQDEPPRVRYRLELPALDEFRRAVGSL